MKDKKNSITTGIYCGSRFPETRPESTGEAGGAAETGKRRLEVGELDRQRPHGALEIVIHFSEDPAQLQFLRRHKHLRCQRVTCRAFGPKRLF